MKNQNTPSKPHTISRREFIASAGTIIGGTLLTSGLSASCISNNTSFTTATKLKYVCPYDGKSFDTFEQLSEYIETNFPGEQPITRFVSPFDEKTFGSLTDLKAHLEELFSHVTFTVLNINGQNYSIAIEDHWSLSFVIREKIGLTGTKMGCDRGACGACTVIIDGEPVYSCLMLAIEAEGKQITTIEGLSNGIDLGIVQQAFVDNDAVQCGYCTPGFIMSAKAFLDRNKSPTRDEIRGALSGHLCICGHTKKVVEAVLNASKQRVA